MERRIKTLGATLDQHRIDHKEIIQLLTLGQEQEEIELVDVGKEEEPK